MSVQNCVKVLLDACRKLDRRTTILQVCRLLGLAEWKDRDVKGDVIVNSEKNVTQIISSKNKQLCLFCVVFFNIWVLFSSIYGVQLISVVYGVFTEVSGGSLSLFWSARLVFGFWKVLHAYLGTKKCFAVTFEAWLWVVSLLALDCLPCSQDAALKKEPWAARGARWPS